MDRRIYDERCVNGWYNYDVTRSSGAENRRAMIAMLAVEEDVAAQELAQRAHHVRLAILSERGLEAAALSRIRAPVGLIPGAKSRATFAVGVLAEIFAHAKSFNLIS